MGRSSVVAARSGRFQLNYELTGLESSNAFNCKRDCCFLDVETFETVLRGRRMRTVAVDTADEGILFAILA